MHKGRQEGTEGKREGGRLGRKKERREGRKAWWIGRKECSEGGSERGGDK